MAQFKRGGTATPRNLLLRDIYAVLYKELELSKKGLPQAAINYLNLAARILVSEVSTPAEISPHIGAELTACKQVMRNYAPAPPTKRPMIFYYYLHEHRVANNDLWLWEIYCEAVKDMGLPEPSDLRAIKGRGTELVTKLKNWLGEAGNPVEEVVFDYLAAVMAVCKKWKPAQFLNVNGVFGDFGWRAFLEWVELQGGAHNYFVASKKQLAVSESTRNWFVVVTQLRAACLVSGNLQAYDELGESGADPQAVQSICQKHQLDIGVRDAKISYNVARDGARLPCISENATRFPESEGSAGSSESVTVSDRPRRLRPRNNS